MSGQFADADTRARRRQTQKCAKTSDNARVVETNRSGTVSDHPSPGARKAPQRCRIALSLCGSRSALRYIQRMEDIHNLGWPGRNTNSIRLRARDGRKSAVRVEKFEPKLTPEQRATEIARRDAIKRHRAESIAQAKAKAEAETARKARGKNRKRSKTKTERVLGAIPPAPRRNSYVDPFARANDPRRLNRDKERGLPG